MDRDRTARYVLGDLDAPERAAFERELRGDAHLREEVTALQRVLQDVRGLPEAPRPAGGAAPAARSTASRWMARLRGARLP
ncbi:MAG TPA: hypothetical protein VIL49_04135 [Capillimicrobium sp.]|jgi:anti-sigma factor RsiW